MAKDKTSFLYERIRRILESARTNVTRTVNTTQVVANWLIGREIVEEEQRGLNRAEYGQQLIEQLSDKLKADFGSDYSAQNLFYMRQFYQSYPSLMPSSEIFHALRGKSTWQGFEASGKVHALRGKSSPPDIPDVTLRKLATPSVPTVLEIPYAPRSESWQPGQLHPNLSWTHYRTLLRVDKSDARSFYEIEAIQNNWSARELERQINSLLYERLALSKDKKGLMRLAKKGARTLEDGTNSLGKETEMQQLRRGETRNYILGKQIPPALKVEPGESFVLETEDASTGIYRTAQDIPSAERLHPFTQYEPRRANPLAGPVYVEGVEKGDLLVVNIEKIIPSTQGATWIIPGSGPLGDSKRWPELGEPAVHIIKHLPGPSGTTRDGIAVFDEKTKWEMKPFIGTIGVAPDVEVETSITGQGKWGGNWDIRDMKEGTKLYLNSYADGGLLFVGDVHGGQGDGEWTGVADETEAELTLSCEVIKKKKIPYARLEKADTIISVFAARPMEDAVNTAIINLIDWIVSDYGVKPREIYFQISTNPDFRINVYQAVKGLRLGYVVGAEYPKKYLPEKAMVSYK